MTTTINDINFLKIGWLNKFLRFSLSEIREKQDQPAFANLQNIAFGRETGLLYGHPLRSFIFSDEIPVIERIKIIYSEGLLLFYLKTKALEEFDIEEFAEKILTFRDAMKLSNQTLKSTLLPSKLLKAEAFINSRALANRGWYEAFWPALNYNSLLFGELLLWDLFLNTNDIQTARDSFFYNFDNISQFGYKNDLLKNTLKTIKNPHENNEFQGIIDRSFQDYFLSFLNISVWAKGGIIQEEDYKIFTQSIESDPKTRLRTDFETTIFILENWKQLNFIKNQLEYANVIQHLKSNLSRYLNLYHTDFKSLIYKNEVLVGIEQAEYDGFDWIKKNEVKKQIVKAIVSLQTDQIISTPIEAVLLAALPQLLPKGVLKFDIEETKVRKKNTIRG